MLPIVGREDEDLTAEEWRKLHNEKNHYLYSSPNWPVVKIRWFDAISMWHVWSEEMHTKFWLKSSKGRDLLGDKNTRTCLPAAGAVLILSSPRLEQRGAPEDGFKLQDVAADLMSWWQLPSVLLDLYFEIIFSNGCQQSYCPIIMQMSTFSDVELFAGCDD